MNPLRSAVAAAFARAGVTARPKTEWQAGDDLHTAYARKVGVPVAERRGTHPDAVMRPVHNRASRRAARERADVLASYSRGLTARPAAADGDQ